MILIKYHQVVNFLITNQPGLPVRFKKYNSYFYCLSTCPRRCLDDFKVPQYRFSCQKEVNETFVAQVD